MVGTSNKLVPGMAIDPNSRYVISVVYIYISDIHDDLSAHPEKLMNIYI
jgi:hypothetical protein